MARCRVSYTDMEDLAHAIDVEAESLYEAVALAVSAFRQDDVNPSMPAAMTEFTVMVYRTPTEHCIRLHQLTKWAEHTVQDGPAGIIKRQKVRALLAQKSSPLPFYKGDLYACGQPSFRVTKGPKGHTVYPVII